jgi:hypothetical protein
MEERVEAAEEEAGLGADDAGASGIAPPRLWWANAAETAEGAAGAGAARAGVAAPARRAREEEAAGAEAPASSEVFFPRSSAASLAACEALIDAALAVARLATTAAEGCEEDEEVLGAPAELEAAARAAMAGGAAVAGEAFFFAAAGAGGGDGERERAAGGNAERADDAAVGLEFTRLCARLAALAARLAPVSAR